MTVPDDSALLHGRYYDPAKARAYYLRTRQLKGRRRAAEKVSSDGRPSRDRGSVAAKRNARRKELEAERAALKKRLARLREVLEDLVDAAKKRSGVPDKKDGKKQDDKADSSSSTKEKSSKDKKSDDLTTSEKKEKAKKAREEYEKQRGLTVSQDVAHLNAQIKDIQSKIRAALNESRRKAPQPKHQTASKGR